MSDLLQELLSAVCLKDDWEAAPSRHSSSFSSAILDVCEVVRRERPFQVVTGFCQHGTNLEVLQLKCVTQQASGRLCALQKDI